MNKLYNFVLPLEYKNQIDVADFKPAYYLPHYNDKPQLIKKITEEDKDYIYIQTDGKKYERHGIILTENIYLEDDMSVEIKVKPVTGSEAVIEMWLINSENNKWISFKLFGGYYGMKKETVVSFNGENIYLPGKLWDWGNWYYFHIQLKNNKTVMALLDENRFILSKYCYDQAAASLFDSFSIAVSQEMGMDNRRSNLMDAIITDVKVGKPVNGIQDLMSMPTRYDLNISEIEEELKSLHIYDDVKIKYDALEKIWKKYQSYEPKIAFFLRPLISKFISFYDLQSSFLDQEDNDDTFMHFKVISEFTDYTPKELTEALDRFSNYHILKSKFYLEYNDDVNEVVYNVYTEVYKNNFFQKLFGSKALLPYYLFKSALFGKDPEKDINLQKDWMEDYYSAAFHKKTKIKILGDILKSIDSLLRSNYGYPKLIEKPKLFKAYDSVILTVTTNFCTEHLKYNSYVKKEIIKQKKTEEFIPVPVEIDVTKFDNIRITAENIKQQLITDDLLQESEDIHSLQNTDELTEVQISLIKAILSNDTALMNTILRENGLLTSVVIEKINEILYKNFNDNCIDFNEDIPVVLEEYIEDLKGIVNL